MDPVLLAAFEGWNDAGAAASGALRSLIDLTGATLVDSLDEEEFYDFQVNRPVLRRGPGGEREVHWPGTRIWRGALPSGRPVLLVLGLEPSFRWREFASQLVVAALEYRVARFLTLGALLADVPHSRDLPVSATSANPESRTRHTLEESDYEGPTGITGIVEATAAADELDTLAMWVSVPHYYSDAPSAKATLALLRAVGDEIGEDLVPDDLPQAAEEWTADVRSYLEENPEVADYVRELERVVDTAASPRATGDAIAAEFEKYLRGREQ